MQITATGKLPTTSRDIIETLFSDLLLFLFYFVILILFILV